MRFSKYLIPLALTIAVVVSLTLSVVLWTNPANYRTNKQTSQTPQTQQMIKPKRYVYSPVQAIHTNADGSQQILVNKLVNTVTEVKKTMHNYKDPKIKTLSKNSRTDYFRIANQTDSIMLNYSDTVSMRALNAIVKNRFRKLPNYKINRIVLPTNNSTKLYLLYDKNFTVYEVDVKKHSLKSLNKVLKMDMRTQPASFKLLNNKPTVYVTTAVQMQPYKYLIDRQSDDYYVSRLLNTQDSTSINVKRRKNMTIYGDQSSLQLTFNSKNRMAEFSDFRPNHNRRNLTATINDSYKNLTKLGLPMDNVRFFSYDDNNRTVTYRTYVEGFPIFRTNGFGTVSTRTMNSSAQRILFSLDNPEVPLPSNKGYVSLPSTETMLKRLENRGYKLKDLQKVRLGYTWKKDSTSPLLIDLNPDWYIYYNNKWRSYTSLMNQY
ncbi:YycH family regulatory protein [Lentilactobacillus otakiensis]|uniref:YycH family regulatory protein n=1 Tax=Lentilactobacillus otakiensis TaxID=481720 RepID=UPI003D17A0FB